MNAKRNRLEVIYDILNVIQKRNHRIKPTQILYEANLSYVMLEEYLKELSGLGFIEFVGKIYFLSNKGFSFLEKYKNINDIMGIKDKMVV
jgi:predicted transcriptional regulator